ncbi:HET-domain-containing protein [Aspergillus piperis CBS 112811]|uniref:HET-domain-containing protein n=1 Tax=Aspergillus piperis CBS 112811 TaxID=1448313 RepID=A0A8G1QSW3_9EURO|nr:HET-domain-containing protein [Aspergillus piperis CBS 112811]RAH51660.1 HET-domain-containing protein [Aspergillus piperis CBS 112811]
MPDFEYFPLDQGPFSTRILRLLPSKDRAAPIKCQLFSYSLQNDIAQEYDALSYVWGDQTDGQSNISINNQAFSVGKNLHSALLRLRGFEFERTLWVDAICIDQNNMKEKEKQIQNMARIYEQARQVVVWLGEEADNSTQALNSIRAAAEAEFAEERFHMPSESATIEGVKSLLLRRWFYRMWIQCGPVRMSGYTFATGIQAWGSYAGPSVLSTTRLIRGAIFRPQYETHSMKKLSLSELVDMHHTNEASILHDKIYALLGLSSDAHKAPGLLPNYQVSWEQLFQRLIWFILNEQVSVKTWPGREYASIQSSGWILGFIVKVEDYQTKTLLQVLLTGVRSADTKKMWKVRWFIRKTVESIKPCDIICLLQGCSEPSIIRYADGCFRVIVLRAVLRKTDGGGSADFQQVRSENNRPALNFHLIWSWEEHISPSLNILDLAAEAAETKSAIEKILWDTNVAMHETAYNHRNIYLPAMFATEDILRLFTERLGFQHPKTWLAFYSLALLYSKGNIGGERIPLLNFDRTKARDILGLCGIQHHFEKNLALLVGHDYRRRMYINEPDFISGSMEVPERMKLQEALKDLLREIRHRPTLELAPLF